MSKDKTLVIITGGTIEALYDPREGTPFNVPAQPTVESSAIPGALEQLGLRDKCDIHPVAMKDSKQVTTGHLDHILSKVAEGDYDKIVIVHGTDTMPLHARYLKRRIAEWGAEHGMNEKTIVFTGAMYPLRDQHGNWRERGEMNDGWENLQRAFKDAQHEKPGVYLEMGQGPWEADTVKKHVETDSDQPTTMVTHSEFQADDPARHETIWRF